MGCRVVTACDLGHFKAMQRNDQRTNKEAKEQNTSSYLYGHNIKGCFTLIFPLILSITGHSVNVFVLS